MSVVPSGDTINLQLGWPSPRLFAGASLLQGATEVLNSESETAKALIYGPHIGHPPLRESVAQWLSTVYNVHTSRERICITNGASANLSNILLKFTDPLYTRCIFMVEPTYFLACPIFEDNGFRGKLRGVPEGAEGIDIDFLRKELQTVEAAAKAEGNKAPTLKIGQTYAKVYKYVIYTVPTFANPSGKTMGLELRKGLVKLAREHDALVVSDDVYDFLSWPADPDAGGQNASNTIPPRLVDIDHAMDGCDEFGNTASNGSFSKLIGPGIRVGWTDSTPAFAHELSEVGSSSSGGAPSHLTSTFVDKMLRSNHLQIHIKDVLIPEYRKRYYALMQCIVELLLPLGVVVETNTPTGVAGGFFTYIRLPEDLPAGKIVAAIAWKKRQLRVAFGHMFTVAGDPTSSSRGEEAEGFTKCLRLCWAWHEEAEIRVGIQRLADTILEARDMTKKGIGFDQYMTIGIR
ncbi:Valine--pyruvate aminotransferase [Kalmusia sp. IMI 367209]|nr:Valine--pyruvate aminotransferase [Kalmusia sp. IMI 367209]